jgi:hypothetical protein
MVSEVKPNRYNTVLDQTGNVAWYKTLGGTRALINRRTPLPHKHLGHVRNVGDKLWRCEHYYSNSTTDVSTLREGKTWVEQRHLLTGR